MTLFFYHRENTFWAHTMMDLKRIADKLPGEKPQVLLVSQLLRNGANTFYGKLVLNKLGSYNLSFSSK